MRTSLGRTLLASALALASCVTAAGAQTGPANPQNPYDSVGHQHNAGLDAVIAMRTEVSSRQVPLAAATVARSQDFVCGADAACRASSDVVVAAARMVGYPEEAQAELVAALDDLQGGFVEQMVGVIDQHAEDPAALASAMKAVEAKILASDLSEEQQRPLLIGASVARYSADYWHRQVNDPDSPWHGEGPSPLGENLRKIFRADAIGATIGAVLGSAGGPGGAVLGGLLGGLICSGLEALDSIL